MDEEEFIMEFIKWYEDNGTEATKEGDVLKSKYENPKKAQTQLDLSELVKALKEQGW